jgi:hypothetical protein
VQTEAIANARAKAQDAQGRARLATGPRSKKQWEDAARRWTAMLAALEAEAEKP